MSCHPAQIKLAFNLIICKSRLCRRLLTSPKPISSSVVIFWRLFLTGERIRSHSVRHKQTWKARHEIYRSKNRDSFSIFGSIFHWGSRRRRRSSQPTPLDYLSLYATQLHTHFHKRFIIWVPACLSALLLRDIKSNHNNNNPGRQPAHMHARDDSLFVWKSRSPAAAPSSSLLSCAMMLRCWRSKSEILPYIFVCRSVSCAEKISSLIQRAAGALKEGAARLIHYCCSVKLLEPFHFSCDCICSANPLSLSVSLLCAHSPSPMDIDETFKFLSITWAWEVFALALSFVQGSVLFG